MREKLGLLGCLAALGVLLLCSADTARAVREGLALCAGSVIPALFPFLAVSGLLTARPELDGVVCVTDTVAFGAMHALKQAGRKIGGDVSLAGVGDSWVGSVTEPGLTTVQFYQKQIGEEAARMLLQMLDEKEHGGPVRQVTLGYRVVERGSI